MDAIQLKKPFCLLRLREIDRERSSPSSLPLLTLNPYIYLPFTTLFPRDDPYLPSIYPPLLGSIQKLRFLIVQTEARTSVKGIDKGFEALIAYKKVPDMEEGGWKGLREVDIMESSILEGI